MPKRNLTQKRLKELLHYNHYTGIFINKTSRSYAVKIGSTAGSLDSDGYLSIMVDNIPYLTHRLAWLYVYGYFPENDIDHKNRKPGDNRIKNLREVSRSCNSRNTGNSKANTSGVKGVSWHKSTNKWRVQITVLCKQKHISTYKDFGEAVCARLAAEQCLNWSNCDSSSPAFQYVQKNIIIKED